MFFCATIQYAIMVVNTIGYTITAGISMRCAKKAKLWLEHVLFWLLCSAKKPLDFGCFVCHDVRSCLVMSGSCTGNFNIRASRPLGCQVQACTSGMQCCGQPECLPQSQMDNTQLYGLVCLATKQHQDEHKHEHALCQVLSPLLYINAALYKTAILLFI